jgi:hypothetical protein
MTRAAREGGKWRLLLLLVGRAPPPTTSQEKQVGVAAYLQREAYTLKKFAFFACGTCKNAIFAVQRLTLYFVLSR